MAKAYKCDRCGKFFINPVPHIEKRQCYGNALSAKDRTYDLCAACLAEFEEWIKGDEE